ncbi:glycoside hydrolase family 30 protein [Mucilaginibacter sp. Bleaf8]|uniref:glycoside hydrolase family 30 protein n=1 Tax=Mucilaginibacter sp. Bleaf8 TaxID=2834430 RepID=UPI001BCBDD1E|nr:glycoside hydrolase family 30 protein [Mucilaginibacter sp. Bleaf8]MBS7566876.1 glycoside hydrolase family 30 protein [Mucilaginibacter sp. Bleaf8]
MKITYLTFALLTACSLVSTAQTTVKKSFDAGNKQVKVYTTAQNTEYRLSETGSIDFKNYSQPVESEVSVFVDPDKQFQTLLGIGGALTDASAEVFAKMTKAQQQEFLTAYYNPQKGIGYTLGRTNIASCDFSSASYGYIAENDAALKTFNIDHDKKYRIPFIKAAIAAAGGKLTMFVSPWSPPAWMKDNGKLVGGGKLLPQYRQSWANHTIKFIKAYEALNIPIWGLSVQNEPMAKQTWESCIFTAEEERDFIKQYLGPTLTKEGMAGKKLIAWDHNRDLMYQRASTVLEDPEAAKYVWGIGYHWYETWTGGAMRFENEKLVKEAFPNTNLMFTEGCVESFKLDSIGSWALGERYGNSLINDFNNGTVGWTDWNILLDEQGGPNHVGNFCYAPVHYNTKTKQLIYTNMYYYLGHFSKFVRPGAKRIISSSSRDALQSTAFQNTDGSIAVIVMNKSDKKVPYSLWIKGKIAQTTSLPHSISTLVL